MCDFLVLLSVGFSCQSQALVSGQKKNKINIRGGSRGGGGGGAHLKKLRRAEGGANIFDVFRVKNHDFMPKNHIFPILGGAREIFGVFHVKNHDFTPKKIIFLPILGGKGGGGAPGAAPPPPESAPEYLVSYTHLLQVEILRSSITV